MARVGVIGIGKARPNPGEPVPRLEELAFEAARAALDDAGMERDQIDGVVLAASDQLDGRAISSMVMAGPAGGYLKDEIKVAGDAGAALCLAAMRIEAGIFKSSLVVAWAPEPTPAVVAISHLGGDPLYLRNTGHSDLAVAAMRAANWMREHDNLDGVSLADAFVTHRSSLSDSEEFSCWPLRARHVARACGGAVALVVAGESEWPASRRGAAAIAGMGWQTAPYFFSDRQPRESALTSAVARSYREAGIQSPSTGDVLEVHDTTAFDAVIALRALGLEDLTQAVSSRLVNRSGGCFAWNPVVAGALDRAAEASRAVLDDEAPRAMAQMQAGAGGQSQSVFVFERAA